MSFEDWVSPIANPGIWATRKELEQSIFIEVIDFICSKLLDENLISKNNSISPLKEKINEACDKKKINALGMTITEEDFVLRMVFHRQNGCRPFINIGPNKENVISPECISIGIIHPFYLLDSMAPEAFYAYLESLFNMIKQNIMCMKIENKGRKINEVEDD